MGEHDREWDALFERIDMNMTDADLAAADAALRDLAPADELPMRPELIAAVVAQAEAEAAARRPQAVVPRTTWWSRVQKFAAAAAAVVGIQSAATAATVSVVGVVAVTAVVLLWPSGQNSRELDFPFVVKLAMRADQPEGDRRNAMRMIVANVRAVVRVLRQCENEALAPEELVATAHAALVIVESALTSPAPLELAELEDIRPLLPQLEDSTADVASRLRLIQRLAKLATTGLAVIHSVPAPSLEMESDRIAYLKRLASDVRR